MCSIRALKGRLALLLVVLLLSMSLAGCDEAPAAAAPSALPSAATVSDVPQASADIQDTADVLPAAAPDAPSEAAPQVSPTASPDAPAASGSPADDGAVRSAAPAAQVSTGGATVITLSGASASVQGAGAAVNGGVVTVSKGGVYTVSGTLDDGRILVDAKGETVTLVLNGARITCSYGSPIYIYKAKLCTLHLEAGSENVLTDGAAYTFADSWSSAVEEEPNACLYSKADLVIQGAGALTVNANYNNGITGKDTLLLRDGVITVNAVNHGVNGKDSNTLSGVTLTVTCGGDAVRSTNDTDAALGWVSITDAKLTLTAGEDGVQAETWATVQGGSCTVTTGGGSAAKTAADVSAKGIKAGGTLTLLSGAFVMDCADDAFHANADLTVSGGSYTVSTGDDAFHADNALNIEGGAIRILTSYEGLEGSDVNITGGDIDLVARDDGVNAAGGADGSGFMDRGGVARSTFGPGGASGTSHTLTISGGTLNVLAGGDGLDANGALALTGGSVTVYSTNASMQEGPLDSDAGISLTGGTVFVYAGAGFQVPAAPSQRAVALALSRTVAANSQVTITCGDAGWTYTVAAAANNILFSAPELQAGQVLTVTSNGETLAQVTLGDGLTSYGWSANGMGGGGRGGMGGTDGGAGGHTGWKQFDGQPGEGQVGFPGGEQPPEGQEGFSGRGGGFRGAPADGTAPSPLP